MRDYIKLLKNKNFTLLYLGQFISSVGTGINFIGLTLYSLKFGNSLMNLGLLLLILKLPSVLLGPIAGTIADTYNRKTLIIICDVTRGIIGILLFFNNSIIIFYIIVFLLTIFDVLFAPSIGGFLPSLIRKEDLVTANSIYASSMQISKLIGPALGGVLVSTFGVNIFFIINGVSFILSGISELFINYTAQHHKKFDLNNLQLLDGIKEGIEYIKFHDSIRFVVFFFAVTSFGFGALPILYVSFINNYLNASPDLYGLFMTINSLGIILGALLIKKATRYLSELKIMIYGMSIYGILYFCFGYFNFIPVNLITFFAIGIVATLGNVSYGVFLQKEVNNKMLGRVYSLDMTLSNTAIIITTSVISLFGDYFEARNLILGFSVFLILVSLISSRMKIFKETTK